MSDKANHSLGDKLDVPGAKVWSRAVGHQLGADRRELRTRAIAPTQKKLFFASIPGTVALRTDELEGDGRDDLALAVRGGTKDREYLYHTSIYISYHKKSFGIQL
jgi:hypothetical protein